jgi:hypothetical protein
MIYEEQIKLEQLLRHKTQWSLVYKQEKIEEALECSEN